MSDETFNLEEDHGFVSEPAEIVEGSLDIPQGYLDPAEYDLSTQEADPDLVEDPLLYEPLVEDVSSEPLHQDDDVIVFDFSGKASSNTPPTPEIHEDTGNAGIVEGEVIEADVIIPGISDPEAGGGEVQIPTVDINNIEWELLNQIEQLNAFNQDLVHTGEHLEETDRNLSLMQINLNDLTGFADQTTIDLQSLHNEMVATQQQASDAAEAAAEAVTSMVIEYALGTEATAPTSGWSTTSPTRTPNSFIWMRATITYGDGRVATADPVLVTGNEGQQGSPGIPGDPGEDGQSLYTWLKYADTPTSGMNDSPEGKAYMGIAYNKTSPTESTNYADYQWTLVKGEPGIPGAPGDDGSPTYTWVKYADSASGAEMSDSPSGKAYIGLAFNKSTDVESSDASDYQWSLIQGAAGRGITSTTVEYQASSSGTTIPTGTWSSTVPATSPGQFLWTRTTLTYTSGSPTSSYSVGKIGEAGSPGSPGSPGVGVDSSTVHYQLSNSGTTAPTGTWVTSPIPVQTDAQPFLWTRTVVNYTDSTSTTYYSVAAKGTKGDQGTQGVSVTAVTPFYQRKPSGDDAPSKPTDHEPSDWTTTEPTFVENTKLYRTERVTFSTGEFSWTDVSEVANYTGIQTAVATIEQVRVSANARNVRITSLDPATSAPATNPRTNTPWVEGDVWWQLDSLSARNVIGAWTHDGSSWEAEYISHQTISSLDVNKLMVGSGTMDIGVINHLFAQNAFLTNLIAKKVVVGSAENLISVDTTGAPLGWSKWGNITMDRNITGHPANYTQAVESQEPSSSAWSPNFPVEPDAVYRVEVWVQWGPSGGNLRGSVYAASGTGVFQVRPWTIASGTSPSWISSPDFLNVTTYGTTWRRVVAYIKVPPAVNQAYLYFTMPGSSANVHRITAPSVVRVSGSTLIEDGALSTRHISAEGIEANVIKSGSFEGKSFTGGTFTGTTINGGTIQTTNQVDRGTKITGNGVKVFNSDGSQAAELMPDHVYIPRLKVRSDSIYDTATYVEATSDGLKVTHYPPDLYGSGEYSIFQFQHRHIEIIHQPPRMSGSPYFPPVETYYLTPDEDTGWVNIPVASGWNHGSGSYTPAYRIRNRVVFLRGWIAKNTGNIGTSYATVATLPAAARPATVSGAYNAASGASTRGFPFVTIEANGEIKVAAASSPGSTTVYITGISYPLD